MDANSALPATPQPPTGQFLPETPAGAAPNGVLVEPFTAPAAVGTPAPTKPSAEQLVEDWFRRHFHGLGDSIHQSLYNHLHAAKEELKHLLARA